MKWDHLTFFFIYSQRTFTRIAKYANGWICTIHNSLDQVRSNIGKIKEGCYKVNRDPEDINIAAILYPNISNSGDTTNKQEKENQQKSRHLLNGDNDLGVNHAILNYNRSPISNDIDSIIDISKRLWTFVR
jgi:alkanesulfonate monooxygenase SsuD/methylene tetrahydromethanopterin reductase-like flavin-dependent oxidoreductase (luciferase family)